MKLITSRSNLRRIRFLLYFFVPVALALTAGTIFDTLAQYRLRSAQETMSFEVETNVRWASKAADVSRKLLEIQQRVSLALTESSWAKLMKRRRTACTARSWSRLRHSKKS